MNIGILGSGIVGRVLATAFAKEGHQVMVGSRNTQKEELIALAAANPGISLGSFSDTAAFGEVIVLATGGSVTLNAIDLAGKDNFSGKTVIDTTNPIAGPPPANGILSYFTTMDKSLIEMIQDAIPAAKVVKAFNSVGNAFMYRPPFESRPTMFICGNDASAKATVTSILDSFGWDTEDIGTVEGGRAIEPLCILWCAPGFLRNQWTHAFKLLKL